MHGLLKKRFWLSVLLLFALSACSTGGQAQHVQTPATSVTLQPEPAPPATPTPSAASTPEPAPSGLFANQVLQDESGEIHYSYVLPEGYGTERTYPMMVVMPGYDRMWFGEDSAGTNLNWSGFWCWTELAEEMIVVSAQLTDWGETSAQQAIALTTYFLENFSVDENRIYAAGYSAGGETMSQAVSLRPDLYAAYLHGASQWDGTFAPVAENGVAVYIFMAEGDEYYGAQRALDAYDGLYAAYADAGWRAEEIDRVLQLQIPDAAWFAARGITGNYHGGANVVFDETEILEWIISHSK